MSEVKAFRLVARSFAAFFLFWVLVDILALPREAIGLAHHLELLKKTHEINKYVEDETYWVRYYLMTCGELILKIVILLWLTGWFYRESPGVKRFFIDGGDIQETSL